MSRLFHRTTFTEISTYGNGWVQRVRRTQKRSRSSQILVCIIFVPLSFLLSFLPSFGCSKVFGIIHLFVVVEHFTMKLFGNSNRGSFGNLVGLCIIMMMMLLPVATTARESVVEVRRRLRRLGGSGSNYHFGGDNGRDHPQYYHPSSSSNGQMPDHGDSTTTTGTSAGIGEVRMFMYICCEQTNKIYFK